MTKKILFTMFLFLCISFYALEASHASETKRWFYDWDFNHWNDLDFQPSIEQYSTTQQPITKANPWPYKNKTKVEIIRSIQNADLMRKFYIDKKSKKPTLEVGPHFYTLSSTQKRKMIATIDTIYGITRGSGGAITIKDWYTRKTIGHATHRGVMLF